MDAKTFFALLKEEQQFEITEKTNDQRVEWAKEIATNLIGSIIKKEPNNYDGIKGYIMGCEMYIASLGE